MDERFVERGETALHLGDLGVGQRAGPIGGRGGFGQCEAGKVRLRGLHGGQLLGQRRAASGRKLEIETGRAGGAVHAQAKHHVLRLVDQRDRLLKQLLNAEGADVVPLERRHSSDISDMPTWAPA